MARPRTPVALNDLAELLTDRIAGLTRQIQAGQVTPPPISEQVWAQLFQTIGALAHLKAVVNTRPSLTGKE